MMHYVYVVKCVDGTLYTGSTTDVARRIQAHQQGTGAKYTRSRLPVHLLAAWEYPTRSAALRAEIAFKKLSRTEKLARIQGMNAAR